jgi:hypothetical protein
LESQCMQTKGRFKAVVAGGYAVHHSATCKYSSSGTIEASS